MPVQLTEAATNALREQHPQVKVKVFDGEDEEYIVSNSFAPEQFDIDCGPSSEIGLTFRQAQRRLKGREFTDKTTGKVFTKH